MISRNRCTRVGLFSLRNTRIIVNPIVVAIWLWCNVCVFLSARCIQNSQGVSRLSWRNCLDNRLRTLVIRFGRKIIKLTTFRWKTIIVVLMQDTCRSYCFMVDSLSWITWRRWRWWSMQQWISLRRFIKGILVLLIVWIRRRRTHLKRRLLLLR